MVHIDVNIVLYIEYPIIRVQNELVSSSSGSLEEEMYTKAGIKYVFRCTH